MKKMFFAIAFALGTMGITNAQEINGKFMAEFSKLNTYLGLQSEHLFGTRVNTAERGL